MWPIVNPEGHLIYHDEARVLIGSLSGHGTHIITPVLELVDRVLKSTGRLCWQSLNVEVLTYSKMTVISLRRARHGFDKCKDILECVNNRNNRNQQATIVQLSWNIARFYGEIWFLSNPWLIVWFRVYTDTNTCRKTLCLLIKNIWFLIFYDDVLSVYLWNGNWVL
jgi:hypothetical protein